MHQNRFTKSTLPRKGMSHRWTQMDTDQDERRSKSPFYLCSSVADFSVCSVPQLNSREFRLLVSFYLHRLNSGEFSYGKSAAYSRAAATCSFSDCCCSSGSTG